MKRGHEMKVHVDANVCSGSGLCIETCPGVFELSDDGISKVKVERVPAELQQVCREAADNCPSEAISIEE
jgi:ferredoxin